MTKQLTKRQIQSQNTYKTIYDVATKLIEKKGFKNITVAEICKEANVSVGSFYNYFKSKYDIVNEIFKIADKYFLDTVHNNLKEGNSHDKIIVFFNHYGDYNAARDVDFIKQLYTGKNNLFAVKERPMQNVLKAIVEKGQNSGEISTDITSDEIVNLLFVTVRGIVYDWCLHDGEYDLTEAINRYIMRITPTFL